jgi:cation diffusion facilitator family transporter
MEQSPRRTARNSFLASCALCLIKLGAGLASGSLALISSGLESGGDALAAMMAFFAVRLSGKPADSNHPYGHRRVENLSALAEAAILAVGGAIVAVEAVRRLDGGQGLSGAGWPLFAAIGVAIIIDSARVTTSWRAQARHRSAALRASALHYATDMAGSVLVLSGLVAVSLGVHEADAWASLAVAALLLITAFDLVRTNARVLMDTVPEEALDEARAAISSIPGGFELTRLRLRESSGQYFADAVVTVPPGQAVVESHALADAIEKAVAEALPGSEVVVHTEPQSRGLDLRDAALAAALAEPLVHEAHDVTIYRHGEMSSVSLHLKAPRDASLQEVHEASERIEEALRSLPAVEDAYTHLEPLEEPLAAIVKDGTGDEAEAARIETLTRERCGEASRELRLLHTGVGLVVFVSVGACGSDLSAAHALASELEEDIRAGAPHIADVVVHTEP